MIVIQGGTVLTVDDAGTVHVPGHVVIDGDRITAVGEGGYPAEVPAGAEVIDASGHGRHAGDGGPALPHRDRQGLL